MRLRENAILAADMIRIAAGVVDEDEALRLQLAAKARQADGDDDGGWENIGPSVDAPVSAREIFRKVSVRVVGVQPSVRPLMRQADRRGPVWEFEGRVQIKVAC